MRFLRIPIIVLSLLIRSSADLAVSKSEVRNVAQMTPERIVIGSLADVSARYDNGTTITVIDVLEFSTDTPLKEPNLLEVRLCGDQRNRLEPAVHTNVALTYLVASHSRVTVCHTLVSNVSWQDGSKWRTVTVTFTNTRRKRRDVKHERAIRSIGNAHFGK
jgi:hypothetical protein